MNEQDLQAALQGLPIAALRYFDSIGSTNDEALAWLQAGASDGSLVVAVQQTQGRGRLNRRWVTVPGAALAFSLILKPVPEEMEHLPLFSPLAAVALYHALSSQLSLPVEIKWPNDILIRRKKTAGILTEAYWDGAHLDGIVTGIGINISPASLPPSGDALFPPTCLESEAGHPVDRLMVLRSVLEAIFSWRKRLGSAEFFQAWQDHLAFLEESVRIETGSGGVYNGKVLGIDPAGNLRLLTEDGKEMPVTAGDVRLRPAPGGD